MGVRRRSARRRILVVGEGLSQFIGNPPPVVRWTGREKIGEGPPSGVLHKHCPLIRCGRPPFGLDTLQCVDRRQIGLSFLLKAALPDAVGVRYSEIAGKG
jgi:hypothetical protein